MALTKAQALDMLESDDLIGIGMAAHQLRLKKKRPAHRHLPGRSQHQLHQFLHRVLFLLRVLPSPWGKGRLHP